MIESVEVVDAGWWARATVTVVTGRVGVRGAFFSNYVEPRVPDGTPPLAATPFGAYKEQWWVVFGDALNARDGRAARVDYRSTA